MHIKLDKQESTTIVAEATNKKKIRSTLACTSSFLTFLHHYSQQRSAVRSTANNEPNKSVLNNVMYCVALSTDWFV